MAIDTNNLNAMLAELKAAAAATQGKSASAAGAPVDQHACKRRDACAAQVDAHKMAEDFASGQNNANLQDVMINLQKASLSFQQMTQVRNKLVSAYHDIMNTQV